MTAQGKRLTDDHDFFQENEKAVMPYAYFSYKEQDEKIDTMITPLQIKLHFSQ